MIRLALTAAILTLASPALADPCKAIPDKGPGPAWLKRGTVFTGPVVHVIDADGLCVNVGGNVQNMHIAHGPSWVEVRLADFYGPELNEPGGRQAKAALERIAKGKRVSCVYQSRSYDRADAVCTLDGTSLGDLMRRAGVREGGRGR